MFFLHTHSRSRIVLSFQLRGCCNLRTAIRLAPLSLFLRTPREVEMAGGDGFWPLKLGGGKDSSREEGKRSHHRCKSRFIQLSVGNWIRNESHFRLVESLLTSGPDLDSRVVGSGDGKYIAAPAFRTIDSSLNRPEREKVGRRGHNAGLQGQGRQGDRGTGSFGSEQRAG